MAADSCVDGWLEAQDRVTQNLKHYQTFYYFSRKKLLLTFNDGCGDTTPSSSSTAANTCSLVSLCGSTMMTMKGFRIYFPAAKYAGVQTGIHFPKGFTSVKKVLFYYVYNIFRYGARHEISAAMV